MESPSHPAAEAGAHRHTGDGAGHCTACLLGLCCVSGVRAQAGMYRICLAIVRRNALRD